MPADKGFQDAVEQLDDAQEGENGEADAGGKGRGQPGAQKRAEKQGDGQQRRAYAVDDGHRQEGDPDVAGAVGEAGEEGVGGQGGHQQEGLENGRPELGQGEHTAFLAS